MANDQTSRSNETADRILQDHRNLNELTGEICLTTDLRELLSKLDHLRAELEKHFQREEAPDGFGTVVAESAPHKANAIDHLFAEHAEFLASLASLRQSVEECLTGPVADVRNSAGVLCDCLRKHEAREHELLSEAMYRDIGGG
jgi:iron-sulfur cluster repair protein YtfE (RIC family)